MKLKLQDRSRRLEKCRPFCIPGGETVVGEIPKNSETPKPTPPRSKSRRPRDLSVPYYAPHCCPVSGTCYIFNVPCFSCQVRFLPLLSLSLFLRPADIWRVPALSFLRATAALRSATVHTARKFICSQDILLSSCKRSCLLPPPPFLFFFFLLPQVRGHLRVAAVTRGAASLSFQDAPR